MKVAVIADIHGNIFALEKVLTDIEMENVDLIISAGDMINPSYQSKNVWNLLKKHKVVCLRGNHEEYLVDYFKQKEYLNSYNMKPIRKVAETFSVSDVREIGKLPLSYTVKAGNQEFYVCHASPKCNKTSFMNDFTEDIKQQIQNLPAKIIINAHLHTQNQKAWRDKQLIAVGSVGLPMNRTQKADYGLVEFFNNKWNFRHKSVNYDSDKAVHNLIDSGFIHDSGSLSWLLLEELLTADKCFAHFIPYIKSKGILPETEEAWTNEVIAFLRRINRWDTIKKLII